MTLRPDVEDDGWRPPGLFARLVTTRGPMVPVITVMGRARGRRSEPRPRELGLLHAAGTRAVARLRDEGHGPGTGWRVRQDHPRRGLVIDVPADVSSAEVVEWALTAAQVLSGFSFDEWVATAHDG
ncbi:MAG: hypothetical protein S0880_10435 [Actinomycetota bacterium]|nr:hypothetical protein [Actinomycetota bacterium]